MGSKCCIPVFHGNCRYSRSSDTCCGIPTSDAARDSVELYIKSIPIIKLAWAVSTEKTQRSKSSNSSKSNSSPAVRATTTSSREKFHLEVSSERGRSSLSAPSYNTDSFAILPMTKVHSNLYIGNWENSNDAEMLNSEGITHILSLIGHQSSVGKMERKICPMSDYGRSDIKVVLDEVYEFMESGLQEHNNLLVHCKSGQNRSAVVVIAFLMKKFKKTLHRAHRDLRKVRPLIQVNVDYAKQLLDLEREYFGKNSLPSTWMERENDAAGSEVDFNQDMSTQRQRIMFANV